MNPAQCIRVYIDKAWNMNDIVLDFRKSKTVYPTVTKVHVPLLGA